MRKIILTGLPGSGKSTIGKEISRLLNLPFFDLDSQIEEKTGKTIVQLFENSGEEDFRRSESSCLNDIITRTESFVLASGGGTACFNGNMQLMKANALVVFLNPPLDVISARLEVVDEWQLRPIFASGSDIRARLERLLSLRLPYYLQADLVYSGADPVELKTILGNH